jgi:hypothetical protein
MCTLRIWPITSVSVGIFFFVAGYLLAAQKGDVRGSRAKPGKVVKRGKLKVWTDQVLYMANCRSGRDWKFKQPTAMALPTIIIKSGRLGYGTSGFLTSGFLIRRIAR